MSEEPKRNIPLHLSVDNIKVVKDGIQFKCSDTVHSMWNVEGDVVKYLLVKPYCKLIYYIILITEEPKREKSYWTL